MGFLSFISSILSEPSARCYEIFRRSTPLYISASIATAFGVGIVLLASDAVLSDNTFIDNIVSPFVTLLAIWVVLYVALQILLFLIFQLHLPAHLLIAMLGYMSLTFAFVLGLYGSANLIKEGQLAVLNLESTNSNNLFILILPAVVFIAKFYALLVLHAAVQGATQINTFNALAFAAISFLAMIVSAQIALVVTDILFPDTYEILHGLISRPSAVVSLLISKLRGFLY